ncbi:zinc finger and BTB domain-containing protein 41-like [Colias croceus]|uniref:zinc finger and BTB domain-containing protein 41-like n=1 Tax=Colias crocea TaxID=72248 RepID=UPI001E27D937|nr:zinc finger and BTB domain-containing protein 41-like [Colias croceus]XP_045509239.1 zinc finger and BTB domain-containing protein 41-like [Colias croceus]
MDARNDQPVFIDVATGFQEVPVELDKTKVKEEVDDDSQNEEDDINKLLIIRPRKIRCPECSRYTTETAEKMTRHILKVHRGENPFQCFMCDYTTPNKGNFEEHVRRHEGRKPYKCSYCPHRNVSKKNLKKHELIHRPDNPLKCPHCDHIAKHKRGFAFHAKRFHSDVQDGGLTCVKCDSSFDSEEAVKCHRRCQKACTDCDYVACSSDMLDEHFYSKHGKKKSKKKKNVWTCSICGWQSGKHARILLHLIHHPNQEVHDIDISILQRHGIME